MIAYIKAVESFERIISKLANVKYSKNTDKEALNSLIANLKNLENSENYKNSLLNYLLGDENKQTNNNGINANENSHNLLENSYSNSEPELLNLII